MKQNAARGGCGFSPSGALPAPSGAVVGVAGCAVAAVALPPACTPASIHALPPSNRNHGFHRATLSFRFVFPRSPFSMLIKGMSRPATPYSSPHALCRFLQLGYFGLYIGATPLYPLSRFALLLLRFFRSTAYFAQQIRACLFIMERLNNFAIKEASRVLHFLNVNVLAFKLREIV